MILSHSLEERLSHVQDIAKFPVVHGLFYELFTPWRFSKAKTSNCSTGVYVLHAGKAIDRLLKTDESGILYIGQGSILSTQSRLGKLINSLNALEYLHVAGRRIQNLFVKYPIEAMYINVLLCSTPKLKESEYLLWYVDEYGELPPINHQM